MFKNVMLKLLKLIFNLVFNALDKDNDGKLSQEELEEVSDVIKIFYNKIKLLKK